MPWMLSVGLRVVAHLLDGLEELRQSLQREELALQRHQDRIGGRHCVDREQVQRRRAIDQHVAEGDLVRRRRAQRRQRIAQTEGAVARLADLELEARQIDGRGRNVEPRDRGGEHRGAQPGVADEDVIGREPPAGAIDAEAGRGIALGIEVDDQHPLADRGERGAEIDGGRGLADAALLIGDGKDARSRTRSG